jgi:hypothetical protein
MYVCIDHRLWTDGHSLFAGSWCSSGTATSEWVMDCHAARLAIALAPPLEWVLLLIVRVIHLARLGAALGLKEPAQQQPVNRYWSAFPCTQVMLGW